MINVIPKQPKTRKGAASFYVVIFAALAFTVIVVSFIRLMISESSQNIDSDLSQSAYDSALMGVEDAKTALAKCLSSGDQSSCSILYEKKCSDSSAGGVAEYLYPGGGNNSGNKVAGEQGYTCVNLEKDLPDYRVKFVDTYTVVVPIDQGNRVVKISWLNKLDELGGKTNALGSVRFPGKSGAPIPPVLSVGVIRTNDANANIADQHFGTVILRPNAKTNNSNEITDASGAYRTAYNRPTGVKDKNEPVAVTCNTDNDYACVTKINADAEISYLVISLPYHENNVSVKVEQYSSESNINGRGNNFSSQVSVDSTGRANNYYRRVEARLQLADIRFPYPEYALSAHGGANTVLNKNFYVTKHCWNASNGTPGSCTDTGEL